MTHTRRHPKRFIAALLFTMFLANNASLGLASSGQLPLGSYYNRIYSSIDEMASWMYDVRTLDNDYHRSLAMGITQIRVGDTRIPTDYLIMYFLDVAFVPSVPTTALPYAVRNHPKTLLNDNLYSEPAGLYQSKRIGGDDFADAFVADYPWIDRLLFLSTRSPRAPAISKWAGPITVATGLPNDLKPAVSGETDSDPAFFRAPYEKRYVEAEQAVADAVRDVIPAIQEVTGLPVVFLDHEAETLERYGHVRIVLTDEYDPAESIYRLNPPPRGKTSSDERIDFRTTVETQIIGAVKFVPGSDGGLDGYFVPDENNVIQFGVCYLWSGHSEEMIASLTKECMLRVLGLPDTTHMKGESLLEPWREDAAPARKDDAPLPQRPTAMDKLLLRLLYEPALERGTSPRGAYKFLEEYFTNETLSHIERSRQ